MMNLDNDALRALAVKLEARSEEAIGDDERALLRAALAQLAAAQREAVTLRRLLTIHRESGARIDAALADALGAMAGAAALPSPAEGYDFEGADAIRRALVEATHDAHSAQEIGAAALVFARDLLILLGKP